MNEEKKKTLRQRIADIGRTVSKMVKVFTDEKELTKAGVNLTRSHQRRG